MVRIAKLLACVLLFHGGAFSELPQDVQVRLVNAFDALSVAEDGAAAAEAIAFLADESLAESDLSAFFKAYFEGRSFTVPLAQFWDYALRESGGEPRIALLSALCSAEAAAWEIKGIAAGPEGFDATSLMESLRWLAHIADTLRAEDFGRAAQPLFSLLTETRLDIAGLAEAAGGGAAGNALIMQACFTVAAYTGSVSEEGGLGNYVRLPEPLLTFYQRFGIFLFDSGVLDAAQLASLDSLMSLIPPELHEIGALVFPEAIGFDPAQGGFVTDKQMVSLPLISMEATTDPWEFIPRVGQPVAPLFPVACGVEIVRAIQAVQFSRRPALAAQRDALLDRARTRRISYLRRTIPPEFYLENPDDLLPAAALLWFIDSGLTFRMALEYLAVKEEGAMDSVLLLADLLSAGGTMTLLFNTAPDGTVGGGPTGVDRIHLGTVAAMGVDGPEPAPVAPVTAIEMLGYFWLFELDPSGGVMHLLRRDGGGF